MLLSYIYNTNISTILKKIEIIYFKDRLLFRFEEMSVFKSNYQNQLPKFIKKPKNFIFIIRKEFK